MQKIVTLLFLSMYMHVHAMESVAEHNLRLANFGAILKQEIFTVPYFCCGYSCLQDAAVSINALARTNVILNKSINEDDKALALIKQLSQQFDCPNIDVARVLCTQAANKRYTLQRAFLVGWPSWNAVKKDVNKLHGMGLDLNFSYKKKSPTPLIQAVKCGYANIALWLIEKGADVTCCRSDGRNASMIALADYNHRLIDVLIDHQACDVNHQDNEKNTLLHCCFMGLFGNNFDGRHIIITRFPSVYKTIEKLLEKGANPTIINNDGQTPLD